ncbi:hypothetical protein AVEN_18778-1 [Araneus ventricosus]|uniref:Uncharacterized protein n=1 Tax=Araneus ventricosus TaxID=182803 RepID=A0A4Y2U1D3_ARAVE|nr:hypothetical protein AVEN_18778-1 [Araneus ventricosus]
MGIPVMKAGLNMDCTMNGGRRIAVLLMYLYATIVRADPVRTLSHPTCVLLPSRIIGRLECGRTQLEVSEELGIAQSVISRLWQRFQDDGNVSRCYSTGRLRVTTSNEDRYLAVTAKRNRRSTASDLSR